MASPVRPFIWLNSTHGIRRLRGIRITKPPILPPTEPSQHAPPTSTFYLFTHLFSLKGSMFLARVSRLHSCGGRSLNLLQPRPLTRVAHLSTHRVLTFNGTSSLSLFQSHLSSSPLSHARTTPPLLPQAMVWGLRSLELVCPTHRTPTSHLNLRNYPCKPNNQVYFTQITVQIHGNSFICVCLKSPTFSPQGGGCDKRKSVVDRDGHGI